MDSAVPRDAYGRLHGEVVFVWNERRGPAVFGCTVAVGKRLVEEGRPFRPSTVTVMLGSIYEHGRPEPLWTWVEQSNASRKAWQGKVRIEPDAGDPLKIAPIGLWLSLLDSGKTCEPLTPWSLKNHYPEPTDGELLISQARDLVVRTLSRDGRNTWHMKHLGRVAEGVRSLGLSPEAVAAAWLHDALDGRFVRLHSLPQRVQDIVALLTKRQPREKRGDYLKRLEASGDTDAITIRMLDECDYLCRGIRLNDRGWLRSRVKRCHKLLATGKHVAAAGCDDLEKLIQQAERKLNNIEEDQ